MSYLYYLTPEQLSLIQPYFPPCRGWMICGSSAMIIHVLKRGLQWRDAPKEYGPHKTLYNRFIRWSRMGVFDKIFESLTQSDGVPEQLQIDATHLKAHSTAASLLKKGMFPALSDAPKAV